MSNSHHIHLSRNKTPLTLTEAQNIYHGLGLSLNELAAEVKQANFYGMNPDSLESPQELAQSYASQYRYEGNCESIEDARFVDMAYGRD